MKPIKPQEPGSKAILSLLSEKFRMAVQRINHWKVEYEHEDVTYQLASTGRQMATRGGYLNDRGVMSTVTVL
jgi:hypothetical protein